MPTIALTSLVAGRSLHGGADRNSVAKSADAATYCRSLHRGADRNFTVSDDGAKHRSRSLGSKRHLNHAVAVRCRSLPSRARIETTNTILICAVTSGHGPLPSRAGGWIETGASRTGRQPPVANFVPSEGSGARKPARLHFRARCAHDDGGFARMLQLPTPAAALGAQGPPAHARTDCPDALQPLEVGLGQVLAGPDLRVGPTTRDEPGEGRSGQRNHPPVRWDWSVGPSLNSSQRRFGEGHLRTPDVEKVGQLGAHPLIKVGGRWPRAGRSRLGRRAAARQPASGAAGVGAASSGKRKLGSAPPRPRRELAGPRSTSKRRETQPPASLKLLALTRQHEAFVRAIPTKQVRLYLERQDAKAQHWTA
jgi:hypothetical protein